MANENRPGVGGRLVREHINKRAQWLENHPDAGSVTLGKVATTLLEMTPIPLDVAFPPLLAIPLINIIGGLYTVGDLITGGEALVGKTIDGRPLSMLERVFIYGGATLIPLVPARPITIAWDKWQEKHLDPRIKARQAARRKS